MDFRGIYWLIGAFLLGAVAVLTTPESQPRLTERPTSSIEQQKIPRSYKFSTKLPSIESGIYTVVFLPECSSCAMKQLSADEAKIKLQGKKLIFLILKDSPDYQPFRRSFPKVDFIPHKRIQGLDYSPFLGAPFAHPMKVDNVRGHCTFETLDSLEYREL